jgi:hypothetical protein
MSQAENPNLKLLLSNPEQRKKPKMDSYTLTDEMYFFTSVFSSLNITEDELRKNERSGCSKIYNEFYVPGKHKEDLKGKFFKQVKLNSSAKAAPIISLFQNKRYSECIETSIKGNFVSFLPRDVQDYRDTSVCPPKLHRITDLFSHLNQSGAAAAVPVSNETQSDEVGAAEVKQEHQVNYEPLRSYGPGEDGFIGKRRQLTDLQDIKQEEPTECLVPHWLLSDSKVNSGQPASLRESDRRNMPFEFGDLDAMNHQNSIHDPLQPFFEPNQTQVDSSWVQGEFMLDFKNEPSPDTER